MPRSYDGAMDAASSPVTRLDDPWTPEHLVRVTVTVVPSGATAGEELQARLLEWFGSLTPSERGTQDRYALSGGSALERHPVPAPSPVGDLGAQVLVIVSGGEDGLDSAGDEVSAALDLVREVDPDALVSVLEQWRTEDSAWHLAGRPVVLEEHLREGHPLTAALPVSG